VVELIDKRTMFGDGRCQHTSFAANRGRQSCGAWHDRESGRDLPASSVIANMLEGHGMRKRRGWRAEPVGGLTMHNRYEEGHQRDCVTGRAGSTAPVDAGDERAV